MSFDEFEACASVENCNDTVKSESDILELADAAGTKYWHAVIGGTIVSAETKQDLKKKMHDQLNYGGAESIEIIRGKVVPCVKSISF